MTREFGEIPDSGFRINGRTIPSDGNFTFEGSPVKVVLLPATKTNHHPKTQVLVAALLASTTAALTSSNDGHLSEVLRCLAGDKVGDAVPDSPASTATPPPTDDSRCKLISEGGPRPDHAKKEWVIFAQSDVQERCFTRPDGSWGYERIVWSKDPTRAALVGRVAPDPWGDTQRGLDTRVRETTETITQASRDAELLASGAICLSLVALAGLAVASGKH